MEDINGLLNRMLTKAKEQTPPGQNVEINLTASQCYRICDRYQIKPAQLMEAIKDYCFNNDVNLEKFEEEPVQTIKNIKALQD